MSRKAGGVARAKDKVWLAMAILLIVSIIFFGYEMTNADLPMGPIAGILIAYLIYILKE